MQQRGDEIYSAQLVLVDPCLNRWEQSVSWPGVISGGTSFRGIGDTCRETTAVCFGLNVGRKNGPYSSISSDI